MPADPRDAVPWINPIGGLGDALLLSGVLALAQKTDDTKRYNLVRRTRYSGMFRGHPAIERIGFPPPGAQIIDVSYWAREQLGGGNQRPFQILARLFGITTPVEETLFLSQELDQDPAMEEVLRGKERVVILSPVSDSPRKTMPPRLWQPIVDRLVEAGAFIIQVGKKNETHITHAYSLLGITTPRQLAFLIRRSSLVLCVDNFIMHLAHLAHIPAIVVWGPTRHEVYGYPEHVHFPTGSDCPEYSRCLGPQYAGNYATACPLGEEKHCTNTVNGDALSMEAMRLLAVVR